MALHSLSAEQNRWKGVVTSSWGTCWPSKNPPSLPFLSPAAASCSFPVSSEGKHFEKRWFSDHTHDVRKDCSVGWGERLCSKWVPCPWMLLDATWVKCGVTRGHPWLHPNGTAIGRCDPGGCRNSTYTHVLPQLRFCTMSAVTGWQYEIMIIATTVKSTKNIIYREGDTINKHQRWTLVMSLPTGPVPSTKEQFVLVFLLPMVSLSDNHFNTLCFSSLIRAWCVLQQTGTCVRGPSNGPSKGPSNGLNFYRWILKLNEYLITLVFCYQYFHFVTNIFHI